MATRRTVAGEKAALNDLKEQEGKPSDIRPAVPQSVIVKLLVFTFAMITVPIGSYFLTLNSIFKGNSTFAGATAAMMANVVLIAYVITAFREDQSDRKEEEERLKKSE